LRERFFEFKWYEVYDFIEFVACNYPLQNKKNLLMHVTNPWNVNVQLTDL
jgi:hypothetical protein